LLGVLALRDGDAPAAEDYLRRAAEATNTTALYVLSYAELCCKLKDRGAALALTRRALRLDGTMALAWFSLGAQLLDARELAEAERCLQRAAQLDAGLWQARCRLAALPAARGDTLEAERRFTALLREAPDNALVLAEHAALLQDLGRHDDALSQIGRAIESSPHSLDHHLRAADIEMQCGRTEAALRRLESIEHRWPNEPQQVASRAILLRLLDRHEEALVLWAETALRSLSRCAPAATRIVDKDLMNFQHLGLIHRLFPRARIIHCRRDAMDTCFSAYGKLFAGDLPFAYELRELGLYYRDYHALMAHWRGTLPADNFMEVDYETLVSQPDETTRRLVHFLGLPWHEACGRFFETARTVNTASFMQVRQPIYRSSVGRSAALLDHLRPLVEALGPLGPGPA
jgi:tetratricopeptide (TPR) repeat protein